MLEQVKTGLGITGTYQDNTIQTYIDEVVSFLKGMGISETTIQNNVGIVTRGVADLWNYGSGSASLSPYFYQRAIQLKYASDEATTTSESSSLVKNTFSYISTENQSEFAFNGDYDVIEVTVNNLLLNESAYTVGENMVTLNVPLTSGQNVEIILLDIAKGE